MARYQTNRLEGRIIEMFGTQKAFCEAIGISQSTLSRYINEGRDWKGSLLIKAIRALEIPDHEIDIYFFQPRVVKVELDEAKT